MSDYEDDETRCADEILWAAVRVVLMFVGAWLLVEFWVWVWGMI